MLLKRWEPFGDLRRMDHEFDRIWRHASRPAYFRGPNWIHDGHVAVDVYEEGDDLVVRATLPGVKPEDVDASITDNTLTIEAKGELEEEVKEKEYLHRERRLGALRRVVTLPRNLKTDVAEANYENGVLTIRIPKADEAKRKSLQINVKALEGKKS